MSVALKAEIERMRSAMANMVRVGPVHALDPQKGYRIRLGQDADGQPFLSPWLPHPETSKTSVPLKEGQIVGVMSPNGDMRQGVLLRNGYSEANASPNDDMAANVFEDGGVRVEIGGGELRLTIGGVSWTFSGAGEAQTGGQKTHDDLNVGSTHRHTGVVVGGALTEGPV